MVSRLYTPMVPPYTRPHGAGQPVSSATDQERKPAFPLPPPPAQPETAASSDDASTSTRPSAGLQAVQVSPNQKIPLSAVLHDFNSTMSALGADAQTRAEVNSYLRVVQLQGAKEHPEVPFIKHTLKTAAGTLDQFISQALGQPSKVVKEWVDALLMQDIDYHSDLPAPFTPDDDAPTAMATAALTEESPNSATTHASQRVSPGSSSDAGALKTRIQILMDGAKQDFAAGRVDTANAQLQTALDLLDGQNKPGWEGRVWHLRGRFEDASGQWEAAASSYETAASRFEQAHLPARQAKSLHSLASVLAEHNQAERAQGYFRQVVALDEQVFAQTGQNPRALIRSLNDLGSVSLQLNQPAEAIAPLQRAAQLAQAHQLPAVVRSDLLSNLGAAQRANQHLDAAAQSYRQAAQNARQARSKARYVHSLQHMAAVLIEANQPEQAMKALQHLQRMHNNPNPPAATADA